MYGLSALPRRPWHGGGKARAGPADSRTCSGAPCARDTCWPCSGQWWQPLTPQWGMGETLAAFQAKLRVSPRKWCHVRGPMKLPMPISGKMAYYHKGKLMFNIYSVLISQRLRRNFSLHFLEFLKILRTNCIMSSILSSQYPQYLNQIIDILDSIHLIALRKMVQNYLFRTFLWFSGVLSSWLFQSKILISSLKICFVAQWNIIWLSYLF